MKYTYITHGVCSRQIVLELEGTTIKEAAFIGGCHGNTQGIAALVKGMEAEDAIERLEGINCGGRGTSCPDQLATALKEALDL
ncbi:MAG: TIGR03905 family TSCPD domain-containing protein [Ruminococcaceae bacterium]|nr:TIGR03905 family TSCPD domain-containing protein [Oscillospiraceae bacterium]